MIRKARALLGAVLAISLATIGSGVAATPTLITSCPTSITVSGFYEVQTNLTAAGTCITINTSNVVLALKGTITGNGSGVGIVIASTVTGNVIRGSGNSPTISGFNIGVHDVGGASVIGDFNVNGNATTGLLLSGVHQTATMIDNIVANGNGHDGIHINSPVGVRGAILKTNSNGTYGIWIDTASTGSALANLDSENNGTTAFEIAASSNTLYNCRFAGGKNGVVIERHADGNTVVPCEFITDGTPPKIAQALDNNKSCGDDSWFGNTFTAKTKPSCTGDTLPSGTAISMCETIKHAGGYYLKKNLSGVGGNCLIVAAANVTLDLADHTVTGKGSGVGLHVTAAAKNFRGFNGDFNHFATGVEVDADGAIVEGIGGGNNADTGVFVNGANGAVIGEFGATSNTKHGVHYFGLSHALMHNFGANSNGIYGVYVQKSNSNLFSNFTVGNGGANGEAGLYLGCSILGPNPNCSTTPSNYNVVTYAAGALNSHYGWAVDDGSDHNMMVDLNGAGNPTFDAFDGNANCAHNLWFLNATFGQVNNGCIQ